MKTALAIVIHLGLLAVVAACGRAIPREEAQKLSEEEMALPERVAQHVMNQRPGVYYSPYVSYIQGNQAVVVLDNIIAKPVTRDSSGRRQPRAPDHPESTNTRRNADRWNGWWREHEDDILVYLEKDGSTWVVTGDRRLEVGDLRTEEMYKGELPGWYLLTTRVIVVD